MAVTPLPQVVVPDSSFRKEVEHASGENISSCFQCEKCTNGCPLYQWMDIQPHRIMRCVQMGLKNETLRSDTIWVCASCETCTARCPNGIDIAHVMDTLRQISQREKIPASQRSVPIFHNAFLGSIKGRGRVYEGEMILTYSYRNESWAGILKLAGLGLQMFKKGKVKVMPSRIRARGHIKDIFRRSELKG
jgi:heterodisulfide reductase subunit C2